MPIWAPGIPGTSKVGSDPMPVSATCTSISRSFSVPSRSILRNFCRVSVEAFSPHRASSTRSSARISALAETSLRSFSRVSEMEISTRSRMICSTSRPT